MAEIKKIPISEVIKGIRYCQFNALSYLKDARIILQEKRPEHAYVNVQFAIEELGKAILLKERAEAWKNDTNEISIKVVEEWKNHDYKTNKAFQVINPKLKILHKRTRLDKADTKVSNVTRLECGFAEFKEDSNIWWLGPVIDKPALEALINNVEEILNSDILLQLP